MRISLERSMLVVVVEQFLKELIKKYGKYPVSSTDGGGTWYPQACRFLKLEITSSSHSLILRKEYHRMNYSIHKR